MHGLMIYYDGASIEYDCGMIQVPAQRSGIYGQVVHVYRFTHVPIHVFPAHASLISAHASLIFVHASSKICDFQYYGRLA